MVLLKQAQHQAKSIAEDQHKSSTQSNTVKQSTTEKSHSDNAPKAQPAASQETSTDSQGNGSKAASGGSVWNPNSYHWYVKFSIWTSN